MENDDADSTANGGVCLGDLCALLEVVEDGILGELVGGLGRLQQVEIRNTNGLVQLVDVERGLVLSLEIDGVLLDFLSCGHDDDDGYGLSEEELAARRLHA